MPSFLSIIFIFVHPQYSRGMQNAEVFYEWIECDMCWGAGVLACWSAGVLECWGSREVERSRGREVERSKKCRGKERRGD